MADEMEEKPKQGEKAERLVVQNDNFDPILDTDLEKAELELRDLISELNKVIEDFHKKDDSTHLWAYKKMGSIILEIKKLLKNGPESFEHCIKRFKISKRDANEALAAYRVLKRYKKMKNIPGAISKVTAIKIGQMLKSKSKTIRKWTRKLLKKEKQEYGGLYVGLYCSTPSQLKRVLDKVTHNQLKPTPSIFDEPIQSLKVLDMRLGRFKKKYFLGKLRTQAEEFLLLSSSIKQRIMKLDENILAICCPKIG